MLFLLIFLVILPFVIAIANKKPNLTIIFTLLLFIFQYEFSEYVQVEIIQVPIVIRISDLAVILVTIMLVKEFFFNMRRVKEALFSSKLIVLTFIFIIAHTIFFFSKYGLATIAELRFKVFFLELFLYVVIRYDSLEQIEKFYRTIIYVGVLLFFLVPIKWFLIGSITYIERPVNAFTYETITLIMFAFYLYKKKYGEVKFLNFNVVLIGYLFLSFYANHRSVWSMAIVSLFYLLLTGQAKSFKFAISMAVVALAVVYFFPQQLEFLIIRGAGILNPENDDTGNWRILVWYEIINRIIMQKHYWGMGLGSRFEIYVPAFRDYITYGTHNGYMTFLYYLGIPGVTIFIVLIVSLYIKMSRQTKNFQENKYLLVMGKLSIIGSTVYMLNYEADLLSWVFCGLAFAAIINKRKEIETFNEVEIYEDIDHNALV